MAESGAERTLKRGGALDALRFAAAAFITLYHFGAEEAPRVLSTIHPAFGRGFLATDFFLLLSGFILARAYGARLDGARIGAGAFLVRRLARIWPAHIIVLIGFGLLYVGASAAGIGFNHPEAYLPQSWVRQALLIQAWGVAPAIGWNSATWTLSALVVCYALFPALWRVLAGVGPFTALAIGVAVLAAADLIARIAGVDLYRLDPSIGIGRGVPLFILGAAAARFSMGVAIGRSSAWALGLAGAAALAASQAAPGWTFYGMLGLVAVIVAAGTHAPARPSALVAKAAALSFALFITHNLIGLVWFKAVALAPWVLPEPVQWGLWSLVFPVSLFGAWIFDRWIDGPIQARLKPVLARPGRRRSGVVAQPA